MYESCISLLSSACVSPNVHVEVNELVPANFNEALSSVCAKFLLQVLQILHDHALSSRLLCVSELFHGPKDITLSCCALGHVCMRVIATVLQAIGAETTSTSLP